MSFRWMFSLALAALLIGSGAGSVDSARAESLTYEVMMDTSGLTGGQGGLFYVSLSENSPAPSPATVSALVDSPNTPPPFTDGTLGSASDMGFTGSLPGTVSGDNSQYNELDQTFSVGTFFDVFVTLSGTEIGSGGSIPFTGTSLVVGVYDVDGNFVGANFLVNPDGSVDYSNTTGPVMVIPEPATVPEPTGVALLGIGLGAIAVAGRSAKASAGRS